LLSDIDATESGHPLASKCSAVPVKRCQNEKLCFQVFFRLLIFYFLRKSIPRAKVFIRSLLNKGALSPKLKLQQISYTAFIEVFDRFLQNFSKLFFKA